MAVSDNICKFMLTTCKMGTYERVMIICIDIYDNDAV